MGASQGVAQLCLCRPAQQERLSVLSPPLGAADRILSPSIATTTAPSSAAPAPSVPAKQACPGLWLPAEEGSAGPGSCASLHTSILV